MSAADKREELEATLWQAFARSRTMPVGKLVDIILDAADDYAGAAATATLDAYVNEGIRAARARDRREALAEAVRSAS